MKITQHGSDHNIVGFMCHKHNMRQEDEVAIKDLTGKSEREGAV